MPRRVTVSYCGCKHGDLSIAVPASGQEGTPGWEVVVQLKPPPRSKGWRQHVLRVVRAFAPDHPGNYKPGHQHMVLNRLPSCEACQAVST